MNTARERNVEYAVQKRQPPPTAPKTKIRHLEIDDRLGNNDADSTPTINVKELSEQFMRQLSHESRNDKKEIDRGSFGMAGVIVLAENEPEAVRSDIVKSELQAKDEPVFESGRTRNLLQHWKNTEQEYNTTKTSTSRLSTGAKPAWIEEIEEAKGITVDSIGGQPTLQSADQKPTKTKTVKVIEKNTKHKYETDKKFQNSNTDGIYEYIDELNCSRPLINASNYEIGKSGDKMNTYDVICDSDNAHDLLRSYKKENVSTIGDYYKDGNTNKMYLQSNNEYDNAGHMIQTSYVKNSETRDGNAMFSDTFANDQLQRHGYPDPASSSARDEPNSQKKQSQKIQRSSRVGTKLKQPETNERVDGNTTLTSKELDSAHDMLMDILKDLDNQSAELQTEISRTSQRQKSPTVFHHISESKTWSTDSGQHQSWPGVAQPASTRCDIVEDINRASDSNWYQNKDEIERGVIEDSRDFGNESVTQAQQYGESNRTMNSGYDNRSFDLRNNSFRRETGVNEPQTRPTNNQMEDRQNLPSTNQKTSASYQTFDENHSAGIPLTVPWEKERLEKSDSKTSTGKSKKKKKSGKSEKKSCSMM